MTDPLLVCLVGPSGVGKSTLAQRLLAERPDFTRKISHTSRKPRGSEVRDVDYHFVTREAFLADVHAGHFLEHSNVYDNLYGTSRSEVARAVGTGKRGLVLELDAYGASQMRASAPASTVVVFILPPSLETLGLRLRQRATEDTATIERRTADARAEIVLVDSVADYVIVNDDAARAGKTLSALVEAELLKRTSPAWGDMAARLLRNGAIA